MPPMTADTSNGGQGITEAMSKLRTTDGEEAKEVANGDHSDETMISAGKFTLQQMTKQGKGKTHPLDWGYPGELTKEEAAVFARFRDEVEKRGGEFRKTVYSFGETEGEGWALTRWLRARKYKYDDVITMVEEATECRRTPGQHGFYPDAEAALGVDPFVYIQQYPQLYSGNAKSGSPLFISKPGVLNVDGVECITTMEGIYNYHWHVMEHDYANRLIANKKARPGWTRFQCVCVLDLHGLSAAQITKRALNIIQKQTEIDSLCFPETMERMVVVNVPRFFALTWRLIKGWIDPRTAGKIELIASRKQWEGRLRELVDADQLPSDYGGKGEDTNVTLMRTAPDGVVRQSTHLMNVGGHASQIIAIKAGEHADVMVYTRGTNGAVFSIVDKTIKNQTYVNGVQVRHAGDANNENEPPTCVQVTASARIAGPASIKVRADAKSSRFGSSENFLVVCNLYPSP